MNEVDSCFEDLVPWAVDWLSLLATEPYNCSETLPFGMFSIALGVSSKEIFYSC